MGQVCFDREVRKKNYQGQVGLLLLVITGVVVALIMSVASRSLSDTVLSRQQRESSAAFSVAETGVERALNSLGRGSLPGGNVSIQDSTGLVTGQFSVQPTTSYTLFVQEGDVAQLDLSTYVPTIQINWTKTSDPSEDINTCVEGSGTAPAAIEVTSITTSSAIHTYYNPIGCTPANGFTTNGTFGGAAYRTNVVYAVPAGTKTVRIRPIYSGATIAVSGVGLATQLYVIQSSAAGGDAQKSIQVTRGLDAPSSIFDYALFSGNTIVK